MSMLKLPQVRVEGTFAELGEGIGEALADDIAAMIDRRRAAAEAYFGLRGRGSFDDMAAAAGESLEILEGWDADGWCEHTATAAAAGVPSDVLYAAANYSDMRDLVTLDADADEGCTSIAVPPAASRDGNILVGQTWDLHPLDVDSVIAVHRIPVDGNETWSVTVAGAPTLIGMNIHGIFAGTTNIKVAGVRPGVGYMSLLHRAIRCRDREEAAAVIQHAPRTAAHTFLLADVGGAIELECSATMTVRNDLDEEPIVRTNHCLAGPLDGADAEPPSSSSLRRLDRAGSLLSQRSLDMEAIKAIMSDREDGVDSICRHEEDGEPTATNACVIGEPARQCMLACRGPADRGEWVPLRFQTSG